MLKDAGIYTFSNLLNAAVPFLLLPVLTSHLSPSEYGILAAFQVLTNALLPFIGVNAEGAVSRQYFDRAHSDFKAYVDNSLILLMVSTLVVAVLFLIPSGFIATYSDFPAGWLWSVVVFTFGQKLAEILLAIWRVENKAMRYGIFRVVRTGLDMGLSVYFEIGRAHV